MAMLNLGLSAIMATANMGKMQVVKYTTSNIKRLASHDNKEK
jgi:hypothetical protein